MARERLRVLLCALFPGGASEVRTFLRFDSRLDPLTDSIAWDRDMQSIAEQLIERCEAHGLVAEGLLDGLLRARPARRQEIADVAALWGVTLTPTADPPSQGVPRRHGTSWFAILGAALAIASLATYLLWVASETPRSADEHSLAAEGDATPDLVQPKHDPLTAPMHDAIRPPDAVGPGAMGDDTANGAAATVPTKAPLPQRASQMRLAGSR